MSKLNDYQHGYLKGIDEAKRTFEALHSADSRLDRLSYCMGYFDGIEACEREITDGLKND